MPIFGRKPDYPGAFAQVSGLLLLGVQAGLCIAMGIGMGWALDTWLGIHPWGMGIGILWGLAAAIYQTYRLLRENIERFERNKLDS